MGYLPEAMLNYLARLGWSHGNDELFSLKEAIEWFDGSHIGKSPSSFDFDKLKSVNHHWMRQADPAMLVEMVMEIAPDGGPKTKDWLASLMPLLSERAQTLPELAEMSSWLFCEGAPALNEDAKAILNEEAKSHLQNFATFMATAPENKLDFEPAFKDWMAENGLTMKDIGLPLRAALTGTKTAPSILDIVVTLERDETQKEYKIFANNRITSL